MLIMLSHVASVYATLLAFIYAQESGDKVNMKQSVFMMFLNLATFVLRVWFQFAYADFMPEFFENDAAKEAAT